MRQQRLRIFVSSPGDVMTAREVAAQIIENLAHAYARFFAIEPYLWEYEPMLASGHFQDSIDPPSRFDVVILIRPVNSVATPRLELLQALDPAANEAVA